AFLGEPVLPPGPWDALCLWLGLPMSETAAVVKPQEGWFKNRLGDESMWATLRSATFTSRPAHADLLHVDLWWKGQNVLLDPGTFQYNAPPPWRNALSRTAVHNTVTVNGLDQMTPAGQFLWVDWAQTFVLPHACVPGQVLTFQHNGYHRLGIVHRRTMERLGEDRWQVSDALLPSGEGSGQVVDEAVLHWLLPDGDWHLEGSSLKVQTPAGRLQLVVEMAPGVRLNGVQVIRAGETLFGREEKSPVFGWYSPTYGVKLPALAFRLAFSGPLPLQWRTVIAPAQG
ncbi:MAG TPA: heparinase II/III-family protein, partial [Anaerolineaceae bacterium]|nr:heparinase II/III-family protein [Anaerolineaceae bacterium]